MPFIVGTGGGTPVSVESLIIDTLDISSGIYTLEELTIPSPPKRVEWASGADAEGAELVRDPLPDNVVITAKIGVDGSGNQDSRDAGVLAIVAKLEEAEKNPDGLSFTWTAAGRTTVATGDLLSGEVTERNLDALYALGAYSEVTIALTCKPYFRLPEVLVATGSGTAPYVSVELAGVAGNVPALGRIVVTEQSTQSRRYIEWGLEQFFYNHASPSPILIDSEDLVTTGFAGVQATRTGGYRRAGATHDTISATLLGQPIALCGTGVQPHIGTFRVKARLWTASTAQYWRLNYQDGDGPFHANDWSVPVVTGDFSEVDLGLITVSPAKTGTQKWQGRIECYTTNTAGEVGELDYLEFIPAGEGYGKARATYSYSPGVITGHDEFTGTTAGGALSARAAPAGGSWATSGATTDFTFSDNGFTSGSEEVTRATTADTGAGRFAILGASSLTDSEVGIVTLTSNSYASGTFTPTTGLRTALVLRYVDASNYLLGMLYLSDSARPTWSFAVVQVVAGTPTTLGSRTLGIGTAQRALRFIAFSSGRTILTALNWPAYTVIDTIDVQSTALATGGALATGKPGLNDYNPTGTGTGRWYDNFYLAAPAAEPVALYASRTIEFRSDDTLRQDSTGAYYGPPPTYRGSRVVIPCAGDKGRISRVVVKADRNDLETSADTPLGDQMQVQVYATPRFVVAVQ